MFVVVVDVTVVPARSTVVLVLTIVVVVSNTFVARAVEMEVDVMTTILVVVPVVTRTVLCTA